MPASDKVSAVLGEAKPKRFIVLEVTIENCDEKMNADAVGDWIYEHLQDALNSGTKAIVSIVTDVTNRETPRRISTT